MGRLEVIIQVDCWGIYDMTGLIVDRTQYNVTRRATLSAKGWSNMTVVEREEWLGDPWMATGANLFPNGPYYSDSVELKYTSRAMTAKALTSGIYLFAPSIVGEAIKFQNKTFTLSVESVEHSVGTPMIAAYWHDGTGGDYAGGSLLGSGSVTFNTTDFPNVNNRENFALYVYATSTETVEVGASVKFKGVMLETGSHRHEYVPYTEILPTPTTKGAYNYSDLNRVELAVAELSDSLGLGLTTKTDWKMWDIPTTTEMGRYLSNIRVIRDHFSIDTEIPTSMSNLNYEGANNIEKILFTAYSMASLE